MRMLIHLWMVLTLVLGICGDDMVRRAAEDGITYEGSGMNMGSGGLPITGNSDDEDYSSSFVSSLSYYDGSGSSSYDGSESYGAIEDPYSYEYSHDKEEENMIRMRGEFTIEGISRGNLDWMPDLEDTTSKTYSEFANLIAPLIRSALEAKKNTRNGLVSVKILGFRHGSIITEYEATYSSDSTVSADQIRKSIKDAVANDNFGGITVNPRSVSLVSAIRPVGIVLTDAPPTKVTKAVTPRKPAKATTPNVIATTTVTVSDVERERTRENKETQPPMVPTTQSNAINDKTDPPSKPEPTNNNEVGDGVIDIDTTPEDDPDKNAIGNDDKQEHNPEPSRQSFWELVFSHPAFLAGLVGAVVLALLTVVLLLMFIIYRIKKKDEGSYSLDEPHKVKDPMAYWKDTKEFYA